MSLLARLKRFSARSLYVTVLLVMASTLGLSFIAFQLISQHLQSMRVNPVFDQFDQLQLESARVAYEHYGTPELNGYLTRLDQLFGGAHYLLDAKGRSVITGQDLSKMLPAPPAVKSRTSSHGRWIISHRAQDGQFWFAATGQSDQSHLATFFPYYFLLIGTTVLLGWLAWIGIIAPIRRIADTIARFGQGDLTARLHTRRTDEIGQLSYSFDQMADRLKRLIESERRLLGDISHELRSPLARLKFAVKLARTAPDPKAALDRIERDIDRITSLVADIVEITFIEGDPTVQDMAMLHIGPILDDVMRDCTLEAQFRECNLHMGGSIQGMILGNRELLRRAIENVVRNAIRYAPSHSEVRITLSEQNGEAHIVVRDSGSGVPNEALTRIFDPFFRVDEARDTGSGGTGMGLSIAKRAVQLHHGCIRAANVEPGLRVEITLPLAHAETNFPKS
jgi:signal transduction histidine kinase